MSDGVAEAWERILNQAVALNAAPPSARRPPPSSAEELDRIWHNLHSSAAASGQQSVTPPPTSADAEQSQPAQNSTRFSFLTQWLRSSSNISQPSAPASAQPPTNPTTSSSSMSLEAPNVWERLVDAVDRTSIPGDDQPSEAETSLSRLFLGRGDSVVIAPRRDQSSNSQQQWSQIQQQISHSAPLRSTPPVCQQQPAEEISRSTSRGNILTRWLWSSGSGGSGAAAAAAESKDEQNRAEATAWLQQRQQRLPPAIKIPSSDVKNVRPPPVSARAINALENLVNQIRAREEDHSAAAYQQQQQQRRSSTTHRPPPPGGAAIETPGLRNLTAAAPMGSAKLFASVCQRLDQLRSANEASVRAARPPLSFT